MFSPKDVFVALGIQVALAAPPAPVPRPAPVPASDLPVEPPELPRCKPFTCPDGQQPLRKKNHKIWAYGCTVADPKHPLSRGKIDRCCVRHDACQQICGISAADCYDEFLKCATALCKDSNGTNIDNCLYHAKMIQSMSEPKPKRNPKDKDYDPMCLTYDVWQRGSCECVAADEWEETYDERLKTFYEWYNPEKLNIKDLEEVKKKWEGKEAEMFLALTIRYKDKAITRKTNPDPPMFSVHKPSRSKSKKNGTNATPSNETSPKVTLTVDEEDFDQGHQDLDEVSRLEKNRDAALAKKDLLNAEYFQTRIAHPEL